MNSARRFVRKDRLYIGKFTDREKLDGKKFVGAHEDSTDKNQTFDFDVPLNIEKKLPSTGSRGAMALPMIGLDMMLGGVIVVLSGKKKNCT